MPKQGPLHKSCITSVRKTQKITQKCEFQNNTFRVFIEANSFLISSKSALFFPPFLYSSKKDHTIFSDLLLVTEARRY